MGGIIGVVDRPDHTDPASAGLQHLGDVVGVDATDREEGQVLVLGRIGDQFEADRGASRLGRCLPDRSYTDVIDTLGRAGLSAS